MNRLVTYEDEEGNEFVVLCEGEDFFEALSNTNTITGAIIIRDDLAAWPTNKPLSQDF